MRSVGESCDHRPSTPTGFFTSPTCGAASSGRLRSPRGGAGGTRSDVGRERWPPDSRPRAARLPAGGPPGSRLSGRGPGSASPASGGVRSRCGRRVLRERQSRSGRSTGPAPVSGRRGNDSCPNGQSSPARSEDAVRLAVAPRSADDLDFGDGHAVVRRPVAVVHLDDRHKDRRWGLTEVQRDPLLTLMVLQRDLLRRPVPPKASGSAAAGTAVHDRRSWETRSRRRVRRRGGVLGNTTSNDTGASVHGNANAVSGSPSWAFFASNDPPGTAAVPVSSTASTRVGSGGFTSSVTR